MTYKIVDRKLIEDNNINDPHIYIYDRALNYMVCKDIIKIFELDEMKGPGVISSGYNPNIKNAINLDINPNNPKWNKIYDVLLEELFRTIKRYIKQIDLLNGGIY